MSFLKKLKSFFATPTSFQGPQPEEKPIPDFLFPETAEEWRSRVAALHEEHARQDAVHKAKLAQLKSQQDGLNQSMPTGTDASSELKKRRISRELDRVRAEMSADNSRHNEEKRNRRTESAITAELQGEECERIAHQGRILHQSIEDKMRKEGQYSEGVYSLEERFKEERRLVSLEDGRHFVCLLIHIETMRQTGATKKVSVCAGYYGKNSYDKTVAIIEPTGEYKPPTVKWVTDSLAQMTNEELQKVASNG